MKITHNFLILPNQQIDVREILLDADIKEGEIAQTISTTGISKLRYSGDKLFTEFVLSGLAKITEEHADVLLGVEAIIVVSQTYDQRIPSVSSRIQKLSNLSSETYCIDVMDGCSGYIKALSIASMLQSNGTRKILIIAGDINSSMTTGAELGTKILFGDGISASILEADTNKIETQIFNNGDLSNTISCDNQKKVINMNGFEVFRFTRNVVPKLIKDYLDMSGNTIDSYDLIALHQASDLIVKTICKMLNFSNRLNSNFSCGEIGNLGAGSIGAWLSQGKGLTKRGDLTLLAVGFGSGLSWGIASLTVNLEHNEVIYV
jgi:3-oxoacyl-[acyl-carrier-protein] synthase-3